MLLKIVDSLHFFMEKTAQESAVALVLTAFGHVVVWFCTPDVISVVVLESWYGHQRWCLHTAVIIQPWHLWDIKPTTADQKDVLSVSVFSKGQMFWWNLMFLCALKGHLIFCINDEKGVCPSVVVLTMHLSNWKCCYKLLMCFRKDHDQSGAYE